MCSLDLSSLHGSFLSSESPAGLHLQQGKEGFKGKFWFAETDMKGGGQLKLDKSGKAIITVLRHLGRLSEVWPDTSCGSLLSLVNSARLPYEPHSAEPGPPINWLKAQPAGACANVVMPWLVIYHALCHNHVSRLQQPYSPSLHAHCQFDEQAGLPCYPKDPKVCLQGAPLHLQELLCLSCNP